MTQHHSTEGEPYDAAAADALVADVDAAGRQLALGSAQVLGGLLALGLLRYVRTPETLVDVLAPQIPPGPQRDQLVFIAGAAAGLHAGQQRARPYWDPQELHAAADELYAAAFTAMGSLVRDAANAAPRPPWTTGSGA